MCLITGICGGILGLLGVIAAVVLGGVTTIVSGIVLGSTCCLGTCGAIGVIIYIVGTLCGGSVLAMFGVTLTVAIGDMIVGSAASGYINYLIVWITQRANSCDAWRICCAGK